MRRGCATTASRSSIKHFEGTLELAVRDMRRDKTGQIMVRVNDLADRTNAHWASLLSTLILNGEQHRVL
jgi:hypothetical protein